MSANNIPFGKISTVKELGHLIRSKRKADHLTQSQAAGLCGVGVRFLSEVERGKAGAEVGKVLQILKGMGLDLSVEPRGVSGATRAEVRP